MHLLGLSREYSDNSIGAVSGRKATDTGSISWVMLLQQRQSIVGWMIKGMPQPRKIFFTLALRRSQLQ